MRLQPSSPRAVLVLCVCLLLTPARNLAQAPLPTLQRLPATPVRPAVTLAQALAALPPDAVPEGTTLLCVGAQSVVPRPLSPPDPDMGAESLPESQTDDTGITTMPTDPISILVLHYGRSLQTFGHVQALAPPTMTVLNTDPNLANLPLADLITQSPLPFLLGTLTPDQWQKLSQAGLSVDDLSAAQQGLLRAALPTPLKIAPTSSAMPSLDAEKLKTWTADDWQRFQKQQREAQKIRDAQTQTIPDDLLAHAARLHAYLQSEFVFDVPGQSGYGIGIAPAPQNATKPNVFEITDVWGQQRQQGDRLSRYFKALMPNKLKDGDLRWNRHDLSTPVSLSAPGSVDDLVARLAKATGLELYADPNYGALPVIVLGHSDKPQSARDVMQALALCSCGAWRQVGTAYVLTDDAEGLAIRKAKIRDVVDIWGDRLRRAADSIGDHLNDLRWTQTLPFSPNDPGALPDELRKRVAPAAPVEGFGQGIALSDLPAAIQSGLRVQLHEYEQGSGLKASATKVDAALTPQTPVHTEFSLRFAIDLPGFGSLPLDVNPYRPQHSPPPTPSAGTPAPLRPVTPVAFTETRRAILCAPNTSKQAHDVVDKLATLGFNTLFCSVFTNGHAYVANPVFPPLSDDAVGVLAAAIAEGIKQHVAIYATVDTLCWRRNALDAHPTPLPADVTEDRTLRDETLAQFVRRQMDAGRLSNHYEREAAQSQGERSWVSPSELQVRTRLERLVRAVAIVPGLAGLAFQDTAPPGYLGGGDTGGALDVELGYTPAHRLAFLRDRHADPLDIGGRGESYLALRGGGADVSLDVSIPTFGSPLGSAWDDWRAGEDQALLSDLWVTAHDANPSLPLWMREQRIGFTFDPWIDPKKANKADDLRSEGNALAQRVTKDSILVTLYPGWPDQLSDLADAIRQFRQEFGGGKASGILLDLSADGPDPDPVRILGHLAPLFTATPPPSPHGVQSDRGK